MNKPSFRWFSYSIAQFLTKRKSGVRTEKIGIWWISKHSRCPDTRQFGEYPKPLFIKVRLLSPCQQHPRVDAAPAFVQESSAPFCKSIVHIVPSLVLTLLVSFITKRIVRAEGNVKAAKTDFQIWWRRCEEQIIIDAMVAISPYRRKYFCQIKGFSWIGHADSL